MYNRWKKKDRGERKERGKNIAETHQAASRDESLEQKF